MGKWSRYNPGDAPIFRADTLNGFIDAAQWYSQSKFGGKGGQALGGVDVKPSVVLVEASSFTLFGAILTPTGPSANAPTTNPIESSRRPCITADVPVSESDGIVIVFDPAFHNGTGDPGFAKAVASGVATVKVLIEDASHRFARPEPGNSDYLISDDYGPAFLMYPPPVATEPQFTHVLLGPPLADVVTDTINRVRRRKYPLGLPCLVKDGYGNIVGFAQRMVYPDGTVRCETSGDCVGTGCGEDAIDVIPPDPGLPDQPDPPFPLPESYSVFVTITECEGLTPSGFPYTVTCPGSTEGVLSIGSGGAWFSNIPWDTNVNVNIATSEMVWWTTISVDCGGGVGEGIGATAPVSGSQCAHMAVSFSVGDCGWVNPPSSLDEIEVEAPTTPP